MEFRRSRGLLVALSIGAALAAVVTSRPQDARAASPEHATTTGSPPVAVSLSPDSLSLSNQTVFMLSHDPVTIGADALRIVRGFASVSNDSASRSAPATAGHSARQRTLASFAAIHRATHASLLPSTSIDYLAAIQLRMRRVSTVVNPLRSEYVPNRVIGRNSFPLYL